MAPTPSWSFRKKHIVGIGRGTKKTSPPWARDARGRRVAEELSSPAAIGSVIQQRRKRRRVCFTCTCMFLGGRDSRGPPG